jgi:hypothetical protein
MSRSLELPDEIYADLEQAAKLSWKSPETFIADAAKKTIEERTAHERPKTLYDQVKDLIGSFESGGVDELAKKSDDPYFQGLLKKKREGHL